MSYRLIPRFYYTLGTSKYLKVTTGNSRGNGDITQLLKPGSEVHYQNYARTGLRLLLSSLGKDKLSVGVQAYTCHTVFQAIKKAGHEITFLDITDEFELDLDDLKRKLEKIDVLILTHTFGIPGISEDLKQLVKEKVVIEDCAHSFLSKYKGIYTGNHFDASIFSFGIGKLPPVGHGGMTLIHNREAFTSFSQERDELKEESKGKALKSKLRMLIYSVMMKPPLYGLVTFKLGKKMDKKFDFVDKFSFTESKGLASSKRTFESNFGLFQSLYRKNRENAMYLRSLLSKDMVSISEKEGVEWNNYIFPLLVENQEEMYNYLLQNDVESGKHFHKSTEWAEEFGYVKGDCPTTEKILKHIITLPVHAGVKKSQIKKMAKLLNDYVNK